METVFPSVRYTNDSQYSGGFRGNYNRRPQSGRGFRGGYNQRGRPGNGFCGCYNQRGQPGNGFRGNYRGGYSTQVVVNLVEVNHIVVKNFPVALLATTFSIYLTCILLKLNVSYIATTQAMSPCPCRGLW